MQVTAVHQTLASQSGWLNTSRPLTAEDLRGRIILLDFWTFCCINCMHVIPDLKYLEEKFGDDLTVIGVHSAKFQNERDSENIKNAILRYGIEHAVVNDFDFSIWQRFGVRAWPTFMLINPRGTIEATYSGEGNRDEAEADITRLIEKYKGQYVTAKLPIALEKDKQPESVLRFPGKLDSYSENQLVVSDSGNHRVLLVDVAPDAASASIVTRIGSGREGYKDGSFEEAEFRRPQGVLASRDGSFIYIADTENHALRVADMKARTVTTLAGTGRQGYERRASNAPALSTPLASPWDLAFYPNEKHIAIAMAGTHQLWSYDILTKTLSVIAGNGQESIDDGLYPNNSLSQPSGFSVWDGKLYFVDSETSSLRVFENGKVTTLIGSGLFDFGYKEGKRGEALMQHALGVYADASGVYIADSYNHSLRRYDMEAKTLSNYAGHNVRGNDNGPLAQASFNEPNDIALLGGKFYVADTNNNAIRAIDRKTGAVSTLAMIAQAASGAAEFSAPEQLPNLEKLPAVTLHPGKPAMVEIGLKPGWKINKDAPSALTLFDMAATPKALKTFSLAEVKQKSISLPALKDGDYRLQGTLYYCEEKEGAQCLIKSFDVEIKAALGTNTAALNHLSLKLN